MPARVTRALTGIKRSLWFEPTLMMLAALALGFALPALDREVFSDGQPAKWWGRWVAISAGGARATLSTSATALASILAISVTATMVVIQLAAGMYTSRLLRRFLEDRAIRLFLGALIGSVLYLVMVLGAIRAAGEAPEFVPLISVVVGRAVTVGSLIALIVFIHYTARSVQAATIVRRVAQDGLQSLRREREQQMGDSPRLPGPPAGPGAVVDVDVPGYLQVIDVDQLLGALPAPAAIVRVDVEPGEFLLPGAPLLTVWNGDVAGARAGPLLEAAAAARIRRAFATGRERTVERDPGFAVRQLGDVALKALSPAINDATTAVMAVNELALVAREAIHPAASDTWHGFRRGEHELWMRRFGLASALEPLAEVIDAATDQPTVLERTLEVLTWLAAACEEAGARSAVGALAARVRDAADRGNLSAHARQDVARRYAAFTAVPPP